MFHIPPISLSQTPPCLSIPKSKILNPNPSQSSNSTAQIVTKEEFFCERGIQFEVGESFFRHESLTGRDLGVLAASLYKRSNSQLRVMDAMCGCGIRSLRYLIEAEADFVVANDANDHQRSVILSNLSQVPRYDVEKRGQKRWNLTHFDANRLMTECYLQRDFFDLIDVDSFGSDSSFLRSAFNALKLGGLVYVTSTDGFSSGGHRPRNSLASYGAYIRPMPYSNELGLRMLIGGAVREAFVMGYRVKPLFSYYSYHGPVFRVMLRVTRGRLPDMRHYGFISYCHKCGNSQTHSWDELGKIGCPCNVGKNSSSLVVSGPLWTGPLHEAAYLTDMLNLAEEWGWIGNGNGSSLDKLLRQMIGESDPHLPFGYIKLDEKVGASHPFSFLVSIRRGLIGHNILVSRDKGIVAHRAKLNSPPITTVIDALQKKGYAASRSHISPNAIKTNCSMTHCMELVKELRTAHFPDPLQRKKQL